MGIENDDINSLSNEELMKIINAPAIAAGRQQPANVNIMPPVKSSSTENTMGMNDFQLGVAGAGKVADDTIQGVREVAIGALGSKEDMARYNAEKKAKQILDAKLMSNFPAKVGSFVGNAAIAAATPARVPAQVAVEMGRAGLAPTEGDIDSLELPTRAVQSGIAGAATAAVGFPLNAVGKVAGSRFNDFSPENRAMMEAGRAARRQGIIPTAGAVNGGPVVRGIEAGSGWYPEQVQGQANTFLRGAQQETTIAGPTLGGTTQRVIPGEGLRASVAGAGQRMQEAGGRMWNDLDNYVTTNNLPAVIARDTQATVQNIAQTFSPRTPRGTPNLANNDVLSYVDRVDTANNSVSNQIRAMVNSRNVAAPTFSELHEMQSVVGKALARARRDASAPNSPRSADDAARELGNLYRSISNDVDRWATTNPTAGRMFQQAKSYWRDTVVPNVINNDLYQKSARGSLGSHNRGYDEPRQFFSDIINKPEEAKALYSTMDQQGRDLITSLHLLPDMGSAVTTSRNQSVAAMSPAGTLLETGVRPPGGGGGSISTAARSAAGVTPALWQVALGHLPFSRTVAASQGLQEAKLANSVFQGGPLGRAAWSLAQEGANNVGDGTRKLVFGSKDNARQKPKNQQ